MDKKNYRKGVGMIVMNNDGRFWLGKRIGTDTWQFPQGGIDNGESPIEAAKREIFEEVGIKPSKIKVLGKIKDWVKYEIPKELAKKSFKKKGIVGQKQKWFIFKIKSEACISFVNDPDNEFDDFAWVSYWRPIALIVSFKKEVYRNVLAELLPIYFNEFFDVS